MVFGTDIQVAAAVLSKRYEDQLFKQATCHNRGEHGHSDSCSSSYGSDIAFLHKGLAGDVLHLFAVVPALVITGFLGAGKTTLVQHLLECR